VAPLTEMSRRTQVIAGAGVVAVIALVVAGVLVFRSGKESDDTATTVPETTTTTERVPGPIAPLTGLEDPTGAVATRCAVSVKVGNTADAHPQTGVGAADVVYEEVVDGGITRLVAVYQSTAPDQVGSVRSVRPTDQYILWPLRGVFAFSGGNPDELASLKGVPVVKLDETAAGGMMFRGPGRAPNNLFADVSQMYGACADPPPPPLFVYRPPLTASVGLPAVAADVGFAGGYETHWTWDPTQALWLRSIFGGPDVDPDGRQIVVPNVVVMQVQYGPDPSGTSVEGRMVGSGPVAVYSDGKVVTGTWERPDKSKAAELRDAVGQPIVLTPGQTWVELMPLGNELTTTPG
jgi:hypothetical protein